MKDQLYAFDNNEKYKSRIRFIFCFAISIIIVITEFFINQKCMLEHKILLSIDITLYFGLIIICLVEIYILKKKIDKVHFTLIRKRSFCRFFLLTYLCLIILIFMLLMIHTGT